MVINSVNKFTKYYSYNQLIEEHDILIMTQQEYLQNKDQLDNPQMVVCVRREGGPKEPKMPQWFKQWNEQVYEKKQPQWFKQWNEQVYEKKQPQWFKQWNEQVYEKKQPKWFTTYMEEFAKKNNLKL